MKHWRVWLGAAAVLALAVAPRWALADQYVTTDESLWLYRSANFYFALGQREFAQTYQKEHPGVTAMWAGTAGFLVTEPLYRGYGEYHDGPEELESFLEERAEHTPLEFLRAGRGFMALATGLILAAVFVYLQRMIGLWPGLLGAALLALEPYYVGLSHLLHLDGLLAGLMLLAALAWWAYWRPDGRRIDLVVSAVAAGLAGLTKSPAIFLVPALALAGLWRHVAEHGWAELRKWARPVLGWGVITGAVFVVLWPAMWVDPVGSITQIVTEATGYAETGHAGAFFEGDVGRGDTFGSRFYGAAYVWRASPVALGGVVLALVGLVAQWGCLAEPERRKQVVYWLGLAVLFTLLLSVSDKKADRYLEPAQLFMLMVAWWGYLDAGQAGGRLFGWVIAGAVLLMQVWSLAGVWPYPVGYYNPMWGGAPKAAETLTIGWGEGLDQAGDYLAAQPNAEDLRVFSWYGIGPLSYYFPGQVDTILHTGDWSDSNGARLAEADYIVIYYQQWQRDIPAALLIVLKDIEPEKTIWLNRLPYVQIYRVDQIPVGELEALVNWE